jgi:hypothetical protein
MSFPKKGKSFPKRRGDGGSDFRLDDHAFAMKIAGALKSELKDRNSRAKLVAGWTGANERADWSATWALFPGEIAYVWHGALHAATVANSLTKTGFTVRSQIVWAKERLVMSRGDYHWQHEPCWYAVRKKGNWTGDRKQTTLWTIPTGGQDVETKHSTQKPVECMRRPILNNSSVGDAVYEPFLGSGTTLIAAQSIGRACYGIEIDPIFVDVAIRRWQAFSGERAIRLRDGLSFDDAVKQAVEFVKMGNEAGVDHTEIAK